MLQLLPCLRDSPSSTIDAHSGVAHAGAVAGNLHGGVLPGELTTAHHLPVGAKYGSDGRGIDTCQMSTTGHLHRGLLPRGLAAASDLPLGAAAAVGGRAGHLGAPRCSATARAHCRGRRRQGCFRDATHQTLSGCPLHEVHAQGHTTSMNTQLGSRLSGGWPCSIIG